MSQSNFIIGILGKKGSGKTTLARSSLPFFNRYIVLDTLHEYPGLVFTDFQDMYTYILANSENDFHIVFRPVDDSQIDLFFALTMYINNVVFVFEEVDYYATPTSIQPELLKLLKYGRHYCRSMVYVSRRPAEINRFLTSQTDLLISFYQREPRDIQYLKQYAFTDDVQTLPPYKFAHSGDSDLLKYFS